MTALKIIGIILLVFLLLGFLRLGAIVSYEERLCVQLRVGALKLTVYPRKAKKPKKEKAPKEEKPKEPKNETEKKPKKKPSIPKPTVYDVIDLLDTAFSALGAMVRRTCRRVRIDPLELTLTAASMGNPADTAMLFGALNTAVFTLMPKAEETFYIPDPSIHLRMDYDVYWPSARGTLGISLRLCDLFAIVFTLVIPLGKWFLRFKKAHKHDEPAHKGPADQETEKNEDKDTEERIA